MNYATFEMDWYNIYFKGKSLVAALKDGNHLFHLFVAPPFQRKGLYKQPWVAVQSGAKKGNKTFIVNSTPNAVPVYEKLGFVATGPRKEMNGIAFVPMKSMGG